jgi:F420-dependent oxidoreductase-like protein
MDLRTFVEPQQGTTYDALLAHALAAEELGFGAWFTSDHLLSMGDGDPGPGPTDAWTTLAGLARETTTIRLGTLVTAATFRWPGHFAVQSAYVDQMSGGRVELGIGTGWYEAEHTAMGLPFPDLGTRFDRFEEYLAILTGLWATPDGATFDHDGEHYQLAGNPGLPKPAQSPGPPILVGGRGRKRTPALAARHAAEWNAPFTGPDEFSELVGLVRGACEAIDREPDELTYSVAQVACVGADEDEFRVRAAAIGREPEELRANGVAGTPDEARARIAAYAERGATRLYLQTLDVADLDHLALLATLA